MADEKTTWDIISKRITAMGDRNTRMDETAALLYWDDDPYKLVKPDGKTTLNDAISITPNLAKVFAHGVISDLLGGEWQTVVEGVSGRRSHLLETFVDDNLAQADELLINEHGIPSLDSWLCNHVCVRYAIGVRWIAQVVDGEYKIDCLPVDMRYTPFVRGKWVAPITFRSKEELEEELEEYERMAKGGGGTYTNPANLKDTDNEIRDWWSKDRNEIWVNGKVVFETKHEVGYPPFVIVIPSSGFMLRDKGYTKHEGEDILFLTAGLYKELARSVSLEQTAGYAGLYPAYEQETENQTATPSDPKPKLDESLRVKKGERHIPVPTGDMNRAGMTAHEQIQGMIEAGAPTSPRTYNTPPSAVLLAGETEMIAKLQNARKEALGIFRSQLARMMIDQFIKSGGAELPIGKQGRRAKYSAERLGDPETYTITYHLSVKNKRQELANLAEFAAVYDKLPLVWTLPNILMADDPRGIMDALSLQKAKEINPALDLIEMGIRYLQKAEDTDDETEADMLREQAKILAHEYVIAMRARIQPAPSPTSPVEGAKGDGRLLATAAGALRGDGVGQRRGNGQEVMP